MINIRKLRNAWIEFLRRNNFEWLVTLTFLTSVDGDEARKRCNKWMRKICLEEGIQVAARGVFNRVNHEHLHLLMLGRGKSGASLQDVSIEKWCNNEKWNSSPYGVNIQKIDDLKGAASYIANNMTFDERSEDFFYNEKLLKKTALCKEKGASLHGR